MKLRTNFLTSFIFQFLLIKIKKKTKKKFFQLKIFWKFPENKCLDRGKNFLYY